MVTGATGYLGSAFAAALAEAGATIVATSRHADRAAAAADALPTPHGQKHLGIELDQTLPDQAEEAFDQVADRVDGLSILINNGHKAVGVREEELTAEAFQGQFTNLTGYFILARKLRDHVVAQQSSGTVVMIGSMYGLVGSYPDAYVDLPVDSSPAYHALKGGVIHLTRRLAVYWAQDRVRVNCLSPGPFPSDQAPEELVNRLNKKLPMGRMGKPDELKGSLLLLASDAGSYITGQNIVVDGGWTAW